jgi:hypothetical protein
MMRKWANMQMCKYADAYGRAERMPTAKLQAWVQIHAFGGTSYADAYIWRRTLSCCLSRLSSYF